MSGLDYKTVVVRYGELALKSQRVRRRFEETLIRNIDYALDKKNIIHSIKQEWGRIYVYGSKIEEITRMLTRIFGVVSVSPAFEVQSSVDVIGETVVLVLKSLSPQQGKSFALRVTRTGTHDFTSQSLAIKVGDVVRRTLNLVVDLDEPDVEVFIEVRGEKAFVYTEKLKGPGGLPAGTQGNVMALIESKRDVLASWFLLRRGCSVVALVLGKKELVKSLVDGWFLWEHVRVVEEGFNGEMLKSLLNGFVRKYDCNAVVVGDTFEEFENKFKKGLNLEFFVDVPILRPLLMFKEKEVEDRIRELWL
ncbi:MAG: hypothetical protein DRN01_03035 [Thermoplasmata archaeon]|nr:MAG: hypothetical protein DRN01_03035 [Thermoplasmata archaeon]